MHDLQSAVIVGTVSKHDVGGIIAIVVGVLIVVLGFAKVAAKTAMAFLFPLAGIVVVVLGILLLTRAI